MDRQNVTLNLPADLLRQARHLAVERGVSLSRYLALVLQERVGEAQQFDAARRRAKRRLVKGLSLGVVERIPWQRDELHTR